jgi:hypothetical protein
MLKFPKATPSNLFSKGNTKIHSSCAIFSLPTKVTCKLGLKCRFYCYGNSSQDPKTTDKARARWYAAAQLPNFVELATAELKRMHILKTIRPHAFGDSFSLEYALKWYEIAKALPNVIVYQYTKRDDIYTKEVIAKKPDNYRLIYSYDGVDADYSDKQKWLDMGFDRVCVVYDKLPVQNSCVKGKKDKGYCMTECKKCLVKSDEPIFLKVHGTHKNKR